MPRFRRAAVPSQCAGAMILLLSFSAEISPAQTLPNKSGFPCPEKLVYDIEWRMIAAGTASLELTRSGTNAWETELALESSGMVSRLYRVSDKYRVFSDGRFCASSTNLDAQEGKRHTITQFRVDASGRKILYEERDLIKNTNKQTEVETPVCVHDIVGALAALREIDLPPGKSASVPVTNGKKVAAARIDAKNKEAITVGDQKFQTVRYEAFVFDNVLYRHRGRLFIWLTDDAERLPVQFRVELGFPVGSILLQLEKRNNKETR